MNSFFFLRLLLPFLFSPQIFKPLLYLTLNWTGFSFLSTVVGKRIENQIFTSTTTTTIFTITSAKISASGPIYSNFPSITMDKWSVLFPKASPSLTLWRILLLQVSSLFHVASSFLSLLEQSIITRTGVGFPTSWVLCLLLHYNTRHNCLYLLPPLPLFSFNSLPSSFDPMNPPMVESPVSRLLLIQRQIHKPAALLQLGSPLLPEVPSSLYTVSWISFLLLGYSSQSPGLASPHLCSLQVSPGFNSHSSFFFYY